MLLFHSENCSCYDPFVGAMSILTPYCTRDFTSDKKKMEMGLMTGGGKVSQRREIRPWRQKGVNSSSSLLEALAQVNGESNNVVSHLGEDGVLRMTIVVKKQDLKKMLEVMRTGKSSAHQPLFSPQSSSLEQRLNLLRRKHVIRGNQYNRSRSCRSSWRPALHSIPEEL